MSLPAVELLLRRQGVRDAERDLVALCVNAVAARGNEKAMSDTFNDLKKQAGYVTDTAFKRLLAKAKRAARKSETGSARGKRNRKQ